MQLKGSEVELVSASGRVRVSFPALAAFETLGISQPLKFRFSSHQQTGELGMSQIIAETELIEYR